MRLVYCFLCCLLVSVRAFSPAVHHLTQASTISPRTVTSHIIPTSASSLLTRRSSAVSADDESTLMKQQSDDTAALDEENVSSYRGVRRLEKNARLPVWPVVNGVLIWLVSQVLGNEVAARLEDTITGRVCPNFFQYEETRPFVMLVHHCHSFAAWDPVRYISRAILPEGFPSHPHRGFITVTYILDGGFVHRDSEGVQQHYGGSQADNSMGQESKHTQWLNTGSGMLHEEMFLNDNNDSPFWQPVRQELYQLWLNVPAQAKWTEPCSVLLGGPEETPLIQAASHKTLVLAGSFDGVKAAAPVVSDVTILHVQIAAAGGKWVYHVPPQYETVVLYVRKGSGLQCVTTNDNKETTTTSIPVHHIAHMEAVGDVIVLQNVDKNDVADLLVLAGEPIREPCFASGSMVMSSAQEIDQAYRDYQMGLFGVPWDHKLSDDEWKEHVARTSPKK